MKFIINMYSLGFRHVADGGLDVGAGFAESTKVLILLQDAACLVHAGKVQLIMCLQGEMAQKRILSGMYIIIIGTRDGRKPRMFVGIHGFNPIDGDVLVQQAVQLLRQQLRIKRLLRIEVSRHSAGMHSGIRPSSTHDVDILTQQQRQAALQFALHRHPVGLYLPPVVLRTIIAKPNKIAHLLVNLSSVSN